MLSVIGIIIFLGITSQWVAWKLKIPVIIILIFSGFFAGPILGIVNPNSSMGQELIFTLVELAVALILFDGAMQLKIQEFKLVSGGLKRILTLGVVTHFVLISFAAKLVMDVSIGFACLLAGILIVTGPTVIIPALREANMNKRVSHFLKWEGILTDPFGAIVAVVVYDAIVLSHKVSPLMVVGSIVQIILIAVALSFGIKNVIRYAINKKMVPNYLQIPFATSFVLSGFVFSNQLHHGSGLLMVTILGFLIGNSKMNFLFDLRSFKENVTTMCISFVFILITASIPLDVFKLIGWREGIFIFLVSFVLRLVAILISTLKSRMSLREKVLIGSYGPRGIVAASVAAALSSEMINEGIEGGELFLPIVFLVILSTVIVHGFMLRTICHKLKLDKNDSNGIIFIGTMPWVADLALKLKDIGVPVLITSASWYKLAPFRKLGLKCYYGQILDDLENESIDLSDFSTLMAMSENDSFNLLACEKFAKHLGHENVYHLRKSRNFIHDSYQIEKSSYCILVNDLKLRYENIIKYYENGWVFKETKITEEYKLQDFLNDNERSIVFLKISTTGKIDFDFSYETTEIIPGDILISFAPNLVERKEWDIA